MMADRRRRSPEVSNGRRRNDRRSEYDETHSRAGMRSGTESIYSSSSSSFEIIDISHSFPPNRSGIATFFTAPSERRLRKRRSSRFLKHNNSSSESVGDLASRKGKEIDRERYGQIERERERYVERERYSDREREKSGISRVTTDAEILAVGAGLAKLARDQNKFDLKNAARNGKQAFAAKEFGRRDEGPSRGLGPSRPSHGSDTVDEDGWESASDAESESSVDSRLAFGAESQGGWGFFGRKKYTPQSRKNSIVDPRLFGPANSLHGLVTQPVGFGEVAWTSTSDFGQHPFAVPPAESIASGSQPSMQHVYPIATDDSTRYDAARSSVVSGPEAYMIARPGPIPIQQPQPITPVSQSVYEPVYGTRSETGTGILKKTPTSSGRSKSLAEAALFGVAGAAVGSAFASDQKDERKERRRDDDRDIRDEDRTPKRRDSERRDTKDDRKRDKKDSPERDDRKEKRRDKERTRDSADDRKDKKREKRRDDTREDTREERRERHREERRSGRGDEDRRTERFDGRYESRRSNSETVVSKTSVDPFQYQVENDDIATSTNELAKGHDRVQSIPTVVTVEREPSFTRKRSSSVKDVPIVSRSETGKKDYMDGDRRDSRGKDSYRDPRDRSLYEAESIYQEAEHFTAPLDAAAISAAIAAEGYRQSRSERRRDERRGERRSDYDDYENKPREKESKKDSNDYDDHNYRDRNSTRDPKDYDDYDRQPRDRESKEAKRETERDPIQEEADRAYREIVMARKIASQVIRSRAPSPNRSVVDKYEEKDEEEVIRIVTPPGMDDHKKKGLYDAPNADFQLDHVLEDPREIPRFSLPSMSRSRSNSDAPYLKKDPDASQPRPLLNLVLPTPSPSPLPEKQVARSEPARKSRPEVEATKTSASDVAIGPKGNVVPQASASTVSKAVTWGENETKHFEVESPADHRDEFVSSPEIRARDAPVQEPTTNSRDSPVEQPKSTNGGKRGGWGAIAAGIIGAGAGATAANSSDISKSSKSSKSKSSKNTENEKKDDAPYEYRGVVVEPESPPRSQRQRSPPSTGPNPSSFEIPQPSHIPGAFDDDLDFAATVAAGLQDTGFDPNIVINDPNFHRRDSPPGSNGPGLYHAPYAETVSDLGSVMRESTATKDTQGFIIGEVATTPKDWPSVSPNEEDGFTKLSKKEQKKREKAKRQSGDFTPLEEEEPRSKNVITEPEPLFETKLSKKDQKKRDKEARRQSSQIEDATPPDEPSVVAEIAQEPESYFDEPKKRSKKSKKGSSGYDEAAEDASQDGRKVSVPVDAFDDLQNGEGDWNETKKSKKKSKRDNEPYDSPPRSVPSDIASPLARTSSLSKKSKDKSKRKSDLYEADPTEVSLPLSTPSETSRDGDFDDPRRTRKSSNNDSADRSESRSVVSADASRYDDDEPRKSKRKSKSRDDYDDTRSVASAPAGEDYEEKKSKKKEKDKDKKSGGFFGLFGSKSEVGARGESPKTSKDDFEDVKKKSKKSKRSSMSDASTLYGDTGSQSVGDLSQPTSNGNSNGNGVHAFDDDRGRETWDETRQNIHIRDESVSSKKDSFLAKAGTLGAGAGLAGAAVAIAAQLHQQSKADTAHDSKIAAERTRSRSSSPPRQLEETLDPEITQRRFRPSIDPQYGDLLPLPPSETVSPNVEPMDDLPDLPESRPDTPEADRLARERAVTSMRKSIQDTTPMKSPSHSAVPLKFIMGNRSNPSSPSAARHSPLQSPATINQDSLQFPRTRSRPTSWDNTKEFKPLYLVESNRRGSNVQQQEIEEPLPALPPSQRTSRSSSQLDSGDDAVFEDAEQYPRDMQVRFAEPLSIDTGLAKSSAELLDSEQSTPKASVFQFLEADQSDDKSPEHKSFDVADRSVSPHRSVSPELEEFHDSHAKIAAEAVAGTALVSSIGYSASSPKQNPTDRSSLEEIASHSEALPSPVNPTTKDRSSYLLQSSPMSRKTEYDDSGGSLEESPTNAQPPSEFTTDIVLERDGKADLELLDELQPFIEQEREKTLDTLSGTPYEQPLMQETEEPLQSQESDPATIDIEEAEPAEEFVFSKSKKDKKKEKKKGKALSRSSTQNDIALPETSLAPLEEPSIPVEAELAEEFSLPKSKKDKKKSKLSRSSTQDALSTEEPIREIIEAPSTSATTYPVEEFSGPKSKKDKKKEKKGKSAMVLEPVEELESLRPDKFFETTEAVVVPEETPVQDDFIAADSKKSKKKDKKNRKSIAAWEPDEDNPSAAIAIPTQEDRDVEAAVPVGLGIAEFVEIKPSEAATPSTYASQNQKIPDFQESKQVNVSDFQDQDRYPESNVNEPVVLEPHEEEHPSELTQDALPEVDQQIPRETLISEDSFISNSKKSKKKKGKSVSTWEPDLEQEVPPPPTQELEAFNDFEVPGSKKSKKKGKKSRSLTAEEQLSTEQPQSMEPPFEQTSSRELPISKSVEQAIDESDQFATPGWPTTPPTPWATANEEPPKTSRTDYFPSTAGLHSPARVQSSENTTGVAYFPSTAAMLPTVAAAAAIPAEDQGETTPEANADPETSTSRDLEDDPSRSEQPNNDPIRSVPDGLKAGYDNDQLSLARQLQEEFGSAGKKSKKDKKKRQSLPATPDRDISRSRNTNEASDDHHRARSLSMQPASDVERSLDRPLSEDRKNVYSEDQLELARQLKAEFGSGNKKSKKDKKKRQDLSRTSTQDDPVSDQAREESQNMEPEFTENSVVRETTDSARDGFEAGYQKDQLSLARQLQAEFGSGSKKSKKDKKRRSTSQTPIQEPESQTDYFGETSQLAADEKPRELETADAPESSVLEKDPLRDGLAVGYNEDQLELARQLKEEFSSGAKKSKKDKKKRQSLLRNATDDVFSSDYTPKDGNELREIDTQTVNVTDSGTLPGEPVLAHPEDEFAFVAKRSKKDKKDSKRESILAATTDDIPSESISKELGNPLNTDLQEAAIAPSTTELEDDFAFSTKKSKKDKKGKKRASLVATTDQITAETVPGDLEERPHADEQVESVEAGPSLPIPAEAADDFAFTLKKSKKDKKAKKRESLILATNEDELPRVTTQRDVNEIADPDPSIEVESTDKPAENSEEEFGLTRKKSKKDKKGKKRENLLNTTTDDASSSDNFGKAVEALHSTREVPSQQADDTGKLAIAPFDDDWSTTTTKSKKDNKTQESITAQEGSWDDLSAKGASADPLVIKEPRQETEEPISETAIPDQIDNEVTLEDKSLPPQEDDAETQFENIAFTTKSKKGKNKRKDSSMPDILEPSEASAPIDPIEANPAPILEQSLQIENLSEKAEAIEQSSMPEIAESIAAGAIVEAITTDPADEWGSFPTTKSKKDKKKRRSGLSTPNEGVLEAEATSLKDLTVSEAPKEITDQVANPVEDEWASFTAKKSKKDKKNRKSGLSTPNEGLVEAEATSLKDSTVSEAPKETTDQVADPVDDEWASFNAKKSKKDKKNRKSGLSTPIEEASPVQTNVVSAQDTIDMDTPKGIIDEEVQDPVDEEWGSFTPKKSKKDKKDKRKSIPGLLTQSEETVPGTEITGDVAAIQEPKSEILEDLVDDESGSFTTEKSRKDKKKNKSGLSTPLETLPEQGGAISKEILDVPIPQPDESSAEPKFLQNAIKEVEGLKPHQEERADEEWGSFTTKTSKKDRKKNKSALSTSFETSAENENSAFQQDTPQAEEPKSQLEELLAGGAFTTKRSKDGKNKSELEMPSEDISQTSAILKESQPSEELPEPHQLEFFIEPESTSRDVQEPETPDPVDEWGVFTTKKSKKGKKSKSGASTPFNKEPEPERVAQEDQVKEDTVTLQAEDAAEDEWGSSTTKKSKKGKKRESGLSTPIEAISQSEPIPQEERLESGSNFLEKQETPQAEHSIQRELVEPEDPQFQLPSMDHELATTQMDQSPQEADPAFSFTAKKSKKDKKKRTSGLSTPIDEAEPTIEPSQMQQLNLDDQESQALLTEAVVSVQDPSDAQFDFVTKVSKKDKKKRKSGLSTPIDETEPIIEPSETNRSNLDAPESQNVLTEPEVSVQDPSNDQFDFVTKTSKRDKKKRKSGLSTPIEEMLPQIEAEPSRQLGFNGPLTEALPIERNISETQIMGADSQVQPPETANDDVEFTAKKSKKDKKGKRSSRVNSESGPSDLATPSTAPRIDTSTSDQTHEVSERLTQSPVPLEQDLFNEENFTETDPNSTFQREAPLEPQVSETNFPVEVGRKPSKKDKRKRQATAANFNEGVAASPAPLTSWADEVEEAEVEREVPVIQDIAKDASLSHIASTTESAPIDDFSRPTKKGKKGKKRNSGWTGDESVEEFVRDPIGEESAAEKNAERSSMPMNSATAAVLAGAAFLASKSGEPPKPVDDEETPVRKDVEVPQPARKLSKKEKRKQSIDRRAPSDDIFDDPALWEGAEPRAFEETREGKADAENDGFWSPPTKDPGIPSEEPIHFFEIPHQGPIDLFASTGSKQLQDPIHDGDDFKTDATQSHPKSEVPKPEHQWNDLPDEYVTTSSKKDKKKRKQSRLAAWDTPHEPREVDEPINYPSAEPPRAIFDEPHVVEDRTPPEQRPAITFNEFVEELPVDRDLSFQDDNIRPRSSLRHSHQGASSLPIVREESPVPMDSDSYKRTYYVGTDDFNRDSAFVTDSPIPGQRPFTEQHNRDSGVHLREPSPSERTVAPSAMSDDVIARLSWPAVDEASETVNLHRLHGPSAVTPIHHGDEERISVESPRSDPPYAEDRDSHETYALGEGNSYRHYEDRDLLPSQRQAQETHTDLHRTQTIRGSPVLEDGRPHPPQTENRDSHETNPFADGNLHRHHEDRDLLPSQRHAEENHTYLHRTQTIRRSPTLEDGRPHRHRVHRSHEPEEQTPHQYGEAREVSSLRHEEEARQTRHRVHRSHTPDGAKSDQPHAEERGLPSQRHETETPSSPHRTQDTHRSQESLVRQRVQRIESPDLPRPHTGKEDKYGDLNTSQRPKAEKPKTVGNNTMGTVAAMSGAAVGFAAARQSSRENRPGSGQSQRSSSNINRLRTPDPKLHRPESVGSNRSTPPLRRSDRKSGDLRSLSQRSNLDLAKEAEVAAITAAAAEASTTAAAANPQANEGRVRAKEMADVYDGFGEGRMGSPRSPTRPHSMRRRQSMQVLDLEQRVEQLAAENRALAEAKAQADRILQTTQHSSAALVERDAELDSLKRTLAWLQNEVTRLTEVNDGLTSANITLGNQENDRYNSLESQHAQATRELQEVRDSHISLSEGMEGIVRNEVQTVMADKDREIAELRAQLEAAKEQIREMQRQILESKAGDSEFLTIRDEDYFDNACQQLCQHVQQWVLRFSKFSDMRACRLTSEINNDKIIDRLDNAILDGSDVDSYLADRVKRRDVFMSMTMTMVWEFVFTRYLFGMDREQRQKLKSLEKLLSDVGPASAVHQWRATTLTLLSKREAFVQQREQDTLAVVNAVLETLTEILPPPSQLEQQIQEQLTRVMKAAVDLSIEMRTQRAEYMMLPPLQPEYDANGDLASKVSFNAALMNERSGDTVSNEELEAQKAVVRIVLFPLVVKKGDDSGEGDEEIVVCPAQVLVAKPKKQVRIFSNGSQPNNSRMSLQSSMPADNGDGSVI
ncbi:hypothetical protein D0Z07_2529 [Hyphodiscus hymeniophilus]|uniref:Involucrin repeat protein n=1 Tax=Hyphodiscus hymeniophilus TaxID=353542 RepID=A0A9P7AZA2_9HELO|nr:hypothetical protein D0Z07_2529 [Hyphodiscus hymeniophilus]